MGPKSVFRTFFALTTPEYGLMKAGKSLVGGAKSGKIRLEKNDGTTEKEGTEPVKSVFSCVLVSTTD